MDGDFRQYEDVELFNLVGEMVYIINAKTYDLMFLNNAACESHGIHYYRGRKCYEILRHKTMPCSDCGARQIAPHQLCRWQCYNPVLDKHFKVNGRFIYYRGKLACLKVAIDITSQEQKKSELQNALDAERVINDSVRLLQKAKNLPLAMGQVMEKVGKLLQAARTYLCALREDQVCNVYEWCNGDAAALAEDTRRLDRRILQHWMPAFRRNESVSIRLDDADLSAPEYQMLIERGIRHFVAVPIDRDGQVEGFIGVDDPDEEKSRHITPLLLTLAYSISVTVDGRTSRRMLELMSYSDLMTGVSNRNAFIRDTKLYMDDLALPRPPRQSVGVAYFDLNGLKALNDQYGHQAGDRAIIALARVLSAFFSKHHIYRTGGDEFVVLCFGMEEKDFLTRVRKLEQCIQENNGVEAAVGYEWTPDSENLRAVITRTDARMYKQKKKYYKKHGTFRH